MRGVLALMRLSSASPSGLSSGSGLRGLRVAALASEPRLSWRPEGEKSLWCLLASEAEPEAGVGVRHGLSRGKLRPSAVLEINMLEDDLIMSSPKSHSPFKRDFKF